MFLYRERKMLVNRILLIGCITIMSACTTTYRYKASSIYPRPYPAPALGSQQIKRYVDAVNQIRAEGRRCGEAGYFRAAAPLRWSDALYRSSYEHSRDMWRSRVFGHRGSHGASDWTAKVQHLGHGSSFKERIENNGYTKWRRIAENIESGAHSVDEVMQHWMQSAGHCKNIMNPEFEVFGMARVGRNGSKHDYYWTQDFASHQ